VPFAPLAHCAASRTASGAPSGATVQRRTVTTLCARLIGARRTARSGRSLRITVVSRARPVSRSKGMRSDAASWKPPSTSVNPTCASGARPMSGTGCATAAR
jgi:hypothetical protein